MRVLLDTNVLLDLVLARQPFAADARAVWVACEQGQCEGYVAAIGVTTLWYLGRRQVGAAVARQRVGEILTTLRVAAVDAAVLRQAHASSMTDFEDAVQAASAQAENLDAIVTRNGPDYAASPVPALTPAELLARLAPPAA